MSSAKLKLLLVVFGFAFMCWYSFVGVTTILPGRTAWAYRTPDSVAVAVGAAPETGTVRGLVAGAMAMATTLEWYSGAARHRQLCVQPPPPSSYLFWLSWRYVLAPTMMLYYYCYNYHSYDRDIWKTRKLKFKEMEISKFDSLRGPTILLVELMDIMDFIGWALWGHLHVKGLSHGSLFA